MLRRVWAPAALALPSGISAELLRSRAFDRLISRDVEALMAHASLPGGEEEIAYMSAKCS